MTFHPFQITKEYAKEALAIMDREHKRSTEGFDSFTLLDLSTNFRANLICTSCERSVIGQKIMSRIQKTEFESAFTCPGCQNYSASACK